MTIQLQSLVVVLLCVLRGTTALLCLNCDDIPNSADCSKVVKCGSHERCHHVMFINGQGHIRRNLGCTDVLTCPTTAGRRSVTNGDMTSSVAMAILKSSHQKRSTDTVVCSDCCDHDMCQPELCSDKPYPQRGPICYHCTNQFNHECNEIILCGRDEVCMSAFGETATGSDHPLQTKCMEKSSCYLAAHALGVSVGRKRSFCFNCCETDLCTAGCSGGSTTTTTIAPSRAPTTPCNDVIDPGTCQLASSIVCNNKVLATNAGCLHTCHFC